ncbi:uncharacterized protein [Amphiura filiformis]|uniref:uncharacterized protein n=1 Tax=Amphiura filiformis TaxID=82378 RepID=UPI003B22861A
MASAQAPANPTEGQGSIDKSICAICFEHFQDPRALPCQHGFCLECLRDWAELNSEKTRLVCPTCREGIDLDKDGVEGLPVHSLNMLKSVLKSDEELKDIEREKESVFCGNCSNVPKNNATFHCYDCKQHLCAECRKLHQALRVNQTHYIVHRPTCDEDALPSEKLVGGGRYCTTHDKIIVEFFCESEQRPVCSHCIHLNTCGSQHQRITLKDAAKKYGADILRLVKEIDGFKEEYQSTLHKTEQILQDLDSSKEATLNALQRIKQEFTQKLNKVCKQDEDIINKDFLEKSEKISSIKHKFEKSLARIEEVSQQGTKIGDSDSEVTSTYGLLVEILKDIQKLQPNLVENHLCSLEYTPVPTHSDIDHLLVRTDWKPCGKLCTVPHLRDLCGVAINQDGDIAVSSIRNGLRVFDSNGQVKSTFLNSPETCFDVAITPDNRYVIDGEHGFLCYDHRGNQLSNIQTTDMKNVVSKPYGIAVDTKGRIIAGLKDCLSIHYADGSLKNKVSLSATPWRIAVVSNEQLVVSCYDGTLALIDYNGVVVKVIDSPPGVKKWNPGYVCCNAKYGEIFVGNMGIPKAVYSFKSDGAFIGVVTDEVDRPQGIAVSEDGKKLYIAEVNENLVKIFQRQ